MSAHATRRPRVVMVVNNGMANDARVVKSAQSLHRAGANVTVLGVATPGHPRNETVSAGVRYVRLPVLPARGLTPAYATWALRRRRARLGSARNWRTSLPVTGYYSHAFIPELHKLAPDIVHVHDVHLLGAVDEAFPAGTRRPRVIYDAHEYVAGLAVSGPRTARVVQGWAALEREFIRGADHVITVAPEIAARLEAEHRLHRRPAVVYNAPILWPSPHSSLSLRAEAGLPDDETLLVYSGALSAARGVDTIIRALPLLSRVHLAVVAVPHPHPMAPRLVEQARALGVVKRVHFVRPVPSHEVPAYLSTADIAVSPIIGDSASYDMALPNKLFEFVHAGLPVATSDIRAMSDFVLKHRLGTVFRQNDPQSCAEALLALIARRPVLDTTALRHEFSWQGQEPALVAAYSGLVDGLEASREPWVADELEVRF